MAIGPGGFLAAEENGLELYLSSVFPTLANSILPNRIFKTISSPILEKSYYLPKQLKNTLKKKKYTEQCLSENTI